MRIRPEAANSVHGVKDKEEMRPLVPPELIAKHKARMVASKKRQKEEVIRFVKECADEAFYKTLSELMEQYRKTQTPER